MKNLEQIRAANALAYADSAEKFGGQEGGEVVKKLPAMIMSNGLLAAAAFATNKGTGWSICFDHLARHLAHGEVAILSTKGGSLGVLLRELSGGESSTLKMATNEALAWLSYAGRFVKRDKGEDRDKGGNDDPNGQ